MDLIDRILNPAILGTLIPIVAILSVFGWLTVTSIIKHRERLAMIDRGMHPDLRHEEEEDDDEDDGPVELELPRRERLRDDR